MPQTTNKRKTKKRARTYPIARSQLKALVFKAETKYPHTSFHYDTNTGRLQPTGNWPREIVNYNRDIEFAEFNGVRRPVTHAWPPYTQQQLDRINGVVHPPVSGSSWPLPGAAASQPARPKPVPVTPKPETLPLPVPNYNPLTPVSKTDSTHSKFIVTMPGRGKGRRGRPRGRPTNRSRKWRIQNPALRPKRLPFKQVVPVKLTSGYFDHSFKINELLPELLTVYEEIRVTSLSVVFLTKDVSVTEGLYTAILLDQDGYGTPLKSSATWFKRVADMPGSLVHHAVRGFKLTWVATEPDSRNYVKVIDTADIAKTVARLYIIGQDNTLAISGVLLVRGHCLCRGQYYDATKLTVAMMRDLRLQEMREDNELTGEEDQQEEDDHHEASTSSFDAL